MKIRRRARRTKFAPESDVYPCFVRAIYERVENLTQLLGREICMVDL